jgi:S1-C subfamily serine protease
MQNPLIELSQAIAGTVGGAAQSVVAVSARKNGYQSGILVDSIRILTVDPGVEQDEDFQVLLPNGEVAAASLLGRDPSGDLALLQLQAPFVDAPVLPLAGSATLGELIIGISRSPETGPNASLGMLSSLSGTWRTWKGGKLDHFIKLDLPIYPGISGGLALRADGSLLGMISTGLARGTAVVIPSSNLHLFVETIAAHGELGRGYLGVGLQPVPQPAGMIVLNVEPDSPSALAQLMVGDVILSIGGQRASDFACIQEFLEPPHIGQQIPILISRAGQELELQIEIGRRPTGRRAA